MRGRVERAIADLAADPRPSGVKTLVGTGGRLRIRVGDYRVAYRVEEAFVDPAAQKGKPVRAVVIEVVGHRREVYDR